MSSERSLSSSFCCGISCLCFCFFYLLSPFKQVKRTFFSLSVRATLGKRASARPQRQRAGARAVKAATGLRYLPDQCGQIFKFREEIFCLFEPILLFQLRREICRHFSDTFWGEIRVSGDAETFFLRAIEEKCRLF